MAAISRCCSSDLDRFKNINRRSATTRRKLLQEMGSASRNVRSSDVVARLAGTKFVVLVQEVGRAETGRGPSREDSVRAVEPMSIKAGMPVTRSIGIACIRRGAKRHPDEKRGHRHVPGQGDGKNTTSSTGGIIFQPSERWRWETSLRAAGAQRFFLHSRRARSPHAADHRLERDTLAASRSRCRAAVQFIPLAEETGLIVRSEMGAEHPLAQNVSWQREACRLVMAVNLSARQFADEDLVKDIADALRNSGMKPSCWDRAYESW